MKLCDLISQNQRTWDGYIYHNFVKEVANSTLDEKKFLHYLKQDYLYLKHYSRAYLMAAYKSENLDDMKFFIDTQNLLFTEIAHHQKYCEKFGIYKSELDETNEAIGTISYTRYLLDITITCDVAEILAAILPCAYGYYDFARKIGDEIPFNGANTAYKEWILMYKSDEFANGSLQMENFANKKLSEININSPKGKKISKIFNTATQCEIAFWQQSYQS